MGPFPQRAALRFRVYVGRRVVAEDWVELTQIVLPPESLTAVLSERHIALTERAHRAGLPWMVEVYDPDAVPGREFLRFGTDRSMMTSAVQVTAELWQDLEMAPSFTCPKCGMTSYHRSDVAEGYCGHCHAFTGGSP